MRIAIIGNAPDTLIRFRSSLIQTLSSLGHDVYAFSPGYTKEDEFHIYSLGATPVHYEINRTGTNPVSELVLIGRFRKLFREHNIEMVFSYFLKPVIYGSIAARLTGIKHIYSMLCGLGYIFTDETTENPGLRKRMLRMVISPMFKLALRMNKIVFFQNPDDQNEFVKRNFVKRSNTARVFGSGVDLSQFVQKEKETTSFTFLTMGRLLAKKGFREYAEAARKVKKSYPNARFVLLGGYDENPAALSKEEVQSWVEDGILEHPGLVDDVHRWLVDSSVFVMPSYREGTPRSTLEAMAVGLPVITTDVPGCRETVDHGVNGYLVEARNADALAESMIKMIEEPEMAEQMGEQSRLIAEEIYDVEKVNRSLLENMGLIELEEIKKVQDVVQFT